MSQDSPESDYAEQTNFELSEYFSFDEAFETGETGSQLEAPSDSKQS